MSVTDDSTYFFLANLKMLVIGPSVGSSLAIYYVVQPHNYLVEITSGAQRSVRIGTKVCAICLGNTKTARDSYSCLFVYTSPSWSWMHYWHRTQGLVTWFQLTKSRDANLWVKTSVTYRVVDTARKWFRLEGSGGMKHYCLSQCSSAIWSLRYSYISHWRAE